MRIQFTAVILLTVVGAASAPVFAQLAADPNDRLYTDLQLWQARGLVRNLPPLRPYPVQLVTSLLDTVKAGGDAQDQVKAAQYLMHMERLLNLDIAGAWQGRSDMESNVQQYELGLTIQGLARPDISFSSELGAAASNGQVDPFLPRFQRAATNDVFDPGVAPLGSSGFTPRISTSGGMSVGDDSLYFQAGIQHVSYGPFWSDNIVLSPTAPQAGAVSLVIRGDLFTYTSLFLDITAVNGDGSGGPYPNKFLSLHSLEVVPFPWLTLGAFESVIWGGGLQPVYLLPFPVILFFAQGMFGYADNSFIGISGEVRMPHDLGAAAELYVDDAAFNDLIKLNFNTMLVLAGQAGVTWTPHLPWLGQVGVTYLLITPYVYSHVGSGPAAPNYLDYTNAGQNMGPSLPPDSDRIALTALFRPLPFLDVSIFGRFIRHGNGSDGISGGGAGTIFDDGYVSGVPTFTPGGGYVLPPGILYYTRFMTQAVIEKTFQIGLDAGAHLETRFGTFDGDLGYTFEYVKNADLGASDVARNYLTLGIGYNY